MKWQRERDLLIAQTMAFVQSVTAKAADSNSQVALSAPTPYSPTPYSPTPSSPTPSVPKETTSVPPPRVVLVPARLAPLKQGDMREDIQRRVAAFRARQQLFDRDRREYCNAMLAKVRATTARGAEASDSQPVKR